MVNDTHVTIICSARWAHESGNTEFNIWKFFTCSIFLSTSILAEAIWAVLKNSDKDIWLFVDTLGGTFKPIFAGVDHLW